MSKLLGVIKAIIGQVYVVDASGAQRPVHEGDRVYSGEDIVTGANGAVSLSLPDGKTLDIGRNSNWGDHGLQTNPTPERDAQDIAAVQKAIADGADPTQTLDATAAGNETPVQLEGGGGGHSLVQLALTGQVVDPTAGFDTQGLGSPTWDINLPVGGMDTGTASVFPPEVQITGFAGNDGYINNAEFHRTHLSGTSNQNHVTLTFTDSQKNTFTVDVPVNNGHWNIDTDLGGLVPGNVTVVAIATDVSGRTAQTFDNALIDITGPRIDITVDSVTPDNLINHQESLLSQTVIHGNVGGDAKPGDVVTLVVDGIAYTGTVDDSGTGILTYNIPVLTQGLLNDPTIHASLTSTDDAGNSTTVSTDHYVDNDLYAQNAVIIGTVANDDVVNANESRMPTIISGVASGDANVGDPVTLTLQGKTFHGTVFDDHGQLRYEIVVPSSTLKEGTNDVQVTLVSHDAVGNEAIAITHKTVVLDTQAQNTLTINDVTDDNTLNRAELYMRNQVISGTVSGADARVGDPVQLVINNHQYSGQVIELGNGRLGYRIAVDSSDFANNSGNELKEVNVITTVTSHDNVGNLAIATSTHSVHIDNYAENLITIDDVTADNTLNFNELSARKQIITGIVDGEDAKINDPVLLEINGHQYSGQVIDLGNGKLGYSIEVDSSAFADNSGHVLTDVNVTARVTSHDDAGNLSIATDVHKVHIDNYAENTLTIENVATDNVVNAIENRMPTLISIVAGGDAKVGDAVTISVAGQHFAGKVVDVHGQLHYDVLVPTGVLQEGKNDVVAKLISHDKSGNEVTTKAHSTIILDTHAHNDISLDSVTADNTLTHHELEATTQNITGMVSGEDAKIGDPIQLVVNGHRYSGLVIDLGHGTLGYSIPVDSSSFADNNAHVLADVNVSVMVTSHDAAGNLAITSESHTVHIDNYAKNGVTTGRVANDDVVNAIENRMPTFISGIAHGLDAKVGDIVTVYVQGKDFSGTVVNINGKLCYEVAVPTGTLKEGSNDVMVKLVSHDALGNEAVAITHRTVTLDTQAHSSVNIDNVTDDNILNHQELDMPMRLVRGTVGGDAQVGDEVRVEIRNHTFTGKVIDIGGGKLGYQIPVDSTAFSDNQGSQDKNVSVKVTVISHDAVLNEVITSATHHVHIDNHADAGITVDTVVGDDKLNGAEAGQRLTEVMGTVSGDVHAGAKVQVIVNGHTYETTVEKLAEHNGALGYKLDVLSRDLVKDPHIVARVVGEDQVHNLQKAEITHDLVVDLHAKAILTIDPVAGDNMVNGDESLQPYTYVTGRVGGDVHVNNVVSLTVNGHVLTGKVTDIGNGQLGYSIKVSTADLISDPHLTATVSTTDGAGNPARADAETTVIIDTRINAEITIDSVTSDNTLNLGEQMHGYTLVSGTVSGEIHPGDPFTMKINGHTYSGVVEDRGGAQMGFHISVATSDLVASPHIEVSMDVTDAAKNHAHIVAHHDVSLDDKALAAITIDPVTGDDVLNKDELGKATTIISGTVGGDAQDGDIVHLNIGGHRVDATVKNLPNLGTLGYSINVDTQWLQNDPHITATITTTDAAGNNATADARSTVVIDDQIDATVHIDPIVTSDGDAVINHDEALNPETTVTGTVGGDVKIGDMVELTINDQTYFARVENQNGQHVFSTKVSTLDLLMDPNIHAEVTAKDDAGNIVRATDDRPVVIDTTADAGITIDAVSSAIPPGMTVANDLGPGSRPDYITVTGHVDPDAVRGDHVTITVGHGTSITTDVIYLPDGKLGYQANIGSDSFNDDGNITVAITTHDNHGNTATATEHKVIDLPWLHHTPVIGNTPYGFIPPPQVTTPTTGPGTTQPHQPTVHLTVDKVAGDDILNHDEALKSTTSIRGLVTGDAHIGDDVIVTINNVPYKGYVKAIPTMPGQRVYEVDVPTTELQAHPSFDVAITVKNAAGIATDSAHKEIAVDTENPLKITMDKIARDDVINGKEALAGKVTVSGTVSGEGIHDGSVVNLQVNGNTLTAVVHQDHGQWVWSKEVSVNDLHNNPDIEATVTATDDHGNLGQDTAKSHVVVDLNADAGVTIDSITADNVLNARESLQPKIAVTGSVSGDVHPGDKVTLTVNGNDYAATVDKQHHYSVDIYTKDLLADHAIVATVTGYDNHGNVQPASVTQNYSIDTTSTGSVTINTVGGDDIINADEVAAGIVEVSGRVDGDVHPGDNVFLTVDGVKVETRVIELPHMNGQLGYKALVSTLGLQNDPTIHVSVQGHDAALNPMLAVNDKTVTIDTQWHATLLLDDVTTDDVLNDDETKQAKTIISGHVTGDVDVGDQVTVTVNGKDLVADVKNSGGYKVFSVEASTADLLHDQHITAHVMAHDDAGNVGRIETSKTLTIDRTAAGTIDVDNVTADNVINSKELLDPTIMITGHVGGDANLGDTVKLSIGGHDYTGTVGVSGTGERIYQIKVDTDVLKANTTFDVEVKGHDLALNPYKATATHSYSIDDHADATLIVDKVTGDNHISRAEAQAATTHITGSVTGDVHDGEHINALVNGHLYDTTLHQVNSELRYDFEVDTSSFRPGHNRVNVLVEANDNYGNTAHYAQTLNVIMDDPTPIKGQTVDKGHHAAVQHTLHDLFDDSALSLSYASSTKVHGTNAPQDVTDKAKSALDKVDLSDLARELHEGVDIAKYIQSGDDHHLIASPAKVAHGIDTALSVHPGGDLHSTMYSLDHLIAKPDQNHTH
ncbi:TPA: retention module-containing protein [Citrobacter pasteurii]